MTATPTKRATIRTTHDDATDAERIAEAVRPDNTAEMETRVDGSTIETTIERETTGGLRSTADDYVVNLQVATRLTEESEDSNADSGNEDDTNADDNDADTP